VEEEEVALALALAPFPCGNTPSATNFARNHWKAVTGRKNACSPTPPGNRPRNGSPKALSVQLPPRNSRQGYLRSVEPAGRRNQTSEIGERPTEIRRRFSPARGALVLWHSGWLKPHRYHPRPCPQVSPWG